LRVSGDFLVDFGESSLVRYFGDSGEVAIWRQIEAISIGCFAGCDCLSSVIFESGCEVGILGESAFESCSWVRSICIPSSVETIGKSASAGAAVFRI
jgi:hypothetical protein